MCARKIFSPARSRRTPRTTPSVSSRLAGGPPEFVHEQNRRIAEKPGLQVNVRDPDYEIAREKIEAILEALTFRNRMINGVRYLSVVPTSSPFPLGRDGNERHQFVCNFDIVKTPS